MNVSSITLGTDMNLIFRICKDENNKGAWSGKIQYK